MDSIFIIIRNLFRLAILNAPYLTGLVIPFIVEILNKDVHTEKSKFAVSFLICFVFGVFLKWDSIEHLDINSLTQLSTVITLIFTESQVIYRVYFKDSVVREIMQEKLLRLPEV